MLPQRSKRDSVRISTATTTSTFRCSDDILYQNMIPTDRQLSAHCDFRFFDFVLSSIFRVLSHFPAHNFSLPTALLVTFGSFGVLSSDKEANVFFFRMPRKREQRKREKETECALVVPTITFVCTLREPYTAAHRFSSSLGSIICS